MVIGKRSLEPQPAARVIHERSVARRRLRASSRELRVFSSKPALQTKPPAARQVLRVAGGDVCFNVKARFE
jgi:hypothetical protein